MKIKGFDENTHDGLPRLPSPRTRRVGPVSEDGSFRVADGRVYDPDKKKLRKRRAPVYDNSVSPRLEVN